MKRYLEIEKIVYQELEKTVLETKKTRLSSSIWRFNLMYCYSQYVQLDCELCAIMGLYMIIPFIKTIPHLITLNFQVNLLERC